MELLIATVTLSVLFCAVGVVFSNNELAWQNIYDWAYDGPVPDSSIAAKMFDGWIRKASIDNCSVDPQGSWLEVSYYANSDSTVLDRYARFYVAGGTLKVENGQLSPRTALNTQTLCNNVSNCIFKTEGQSAQMILTLSKGSRTITTVSSAVMHNH